MSVRAHWETIYSTKAVDAVSWYQEHADSSLQLIRTSGEGRTAGIIDVGGGASTLVDDLLDDGFSDVSVLDVSGTALAKARERLGDRAQAVRWIEADITAVRLPRARFRVWHDRAVFHFLTEPRDRQSYVRAVLSAVKPGGSVIVATFAEDGPTKCSGLDVVRYGADALHSEFGPAFDLLRHKREEHRTPFGTVQRFVYCLCRRSSEPRGGLHS